MIGLCDCNNFFVSCQRLFRPDLNTRPTMVLSGNDGCVIARSNEVKALGIKMGVPLFQVKELVKKHNIQLFSANHLLYSDISQRVMATLRNLTPAIEVYSVDEAFIDFSGMDISKLKQETEILSKRIKRETGIPVSIGVAPNKTLAKIASKLCKEYPKLNGSCVMYRPIDIEKVLRKTPIGEVWGVGRKTYKKLEAMGVKTAFDFTGLSPNWVLKNLHVTMWRTLQELKGEAVIPFSMQNPPAQSISIGRTFQHDINTLDELLPIVTTFARTLAEKSRKQGSCIGQISTYLCTNQHRTDKPQRYDSDTITLEVATDSTLEIVDIVTRSLQKIYLPNFEYKKAGVICTHLLPKEHVQLSIFDHKDRDKEQKLMRSIDNLNAHFGGNTIRIATENNYSYNNKNHISPNFTTQWDNIPIFRWNE